MTTDPRCRRAPQITRLKDEAGTRGLEAVFHIAVPADAVLQVLWDPVNYSRLFPDVKSHRVLASSELEMDVEMTVDAVVKQVRYALRRTLDRDKLTIVWREIGGDLRRVRGGWSVRRTERDDVSELTYRAFVDVARFVPSRMVASTAIRKLDDMVARVRRVAADIAQKQP